MEPKKLAGRLTFTVIQFCNLFKALFGRPSFICGHLLDLPKQTQHKLGEFGNFQIVTYGNLLPLSEKSSLQIEGNPRGKNKSESSMGFPAFAFPGGGGWGRGELTDVRSQLSPVKALNSEDHTHAVTTVIDCFLTIGSSLSR